ncbi:hypothetical protein J6590_086259 [Homalodisca vitripennis]|nr:hypothetical protein J6590_086259 [Homalodisca vitripennis]
MAGYTNSSQRIEATYKITQTAVFHGVLDQQSGTQAEAYQTTNFSYAVFHGVLDQQSGTQAGAYHNEFQPCCLPWSLGPAERHTGRSVSNNEFQLRCLPWSLGPAERHTGRSVSQRISATLSSMESWTSRAAHRQGRITTNFSNAVSHGVLDQQSGTQEGAYQTTNFSNALPWSLGPAERHTGRDVSQRISAMLSSMESWTSRAAHRKKRIKQRISAMLSSMESWTSRAAHRQERITTNFCNAVFHGVLDQQSGTQAGAYHNEFQLRCLPWSLGPAERHTGRSVSQRISAMLSSMESWTSRAAHRQEGITTNFCNAVFHGVLDQQSVTLEYDSYPPPFSILHSPSRYHTITSGHLEPEVALSSWPIKMGYSLYDNLIPSL